MSSLALHRIHQPRLEQLTGCRYATLVALTAQVREKLRRGRGRPFKYSVLVMVVLSLMKLRLNLTVRSLEALTGIDAVTVARCVNRVISALGELPLAGPARGMLLVDTTSCRVATTALNTYSGHKHQRCAKVQVIGDESGMVVDVGSSHSGSVHDKTVWNKEARRIKGLLEHLVLADKAYAGAAGEGVSLLRPIKRGEKAWREDKEAAKQFNRGLSKKRVRIEHAFARLKTWRVLSGIFPYRWPRLAEVMRAIAVVHNMDRQLALAGKT